MATPSSRSGASGPSAHLRGVPERARDCRLVAGSPAEAGGPGDIAAVDGARYEDSQVQRSESKAVATELWAVSLDQDIDMEAGSIGPSIDFPPRLAPFIG
eukprot:5528094-Pyramimonas_sp.AAC.1